MFRKTSEPRAVLEPKAVTVAELQKGLHHADLITLKGRLIDRICKKQSAETRTTSYVQTTLTLQTTNFVFTAEKNTAAPNALLNSIPIGSLVQVSGICLLENSEGGKTTSLSVLLPASDDVQVLERPSWLTPQHLSGESRDALYRFARRHQLDGHAFEEEFNFEIVGVRKRNRPNGIAESSRSA